ncbi:MAG: DEAD/DEAH box helicase family protein [Clostridia bacterium]|nr:DEAD/DEAH box helicase family protein [Clostridia bacterium]
MKFNFKIQQYQTDAVDAVVNVFNGQGHYDKVSYIRDLGNQKQENYQTMLGGEEVFDPMDDTGFKNEAIELSDDQLLKNIQNIQVKSNIKVSPVLVKDHGRCSLDIEMETGTGKTYVYIKTIFELNKKYGWSKFIVVVPSIAIREGVKKSFEMMEDHFFETYHKKARFFVYSSSNLNQLDSFSSNSGINVMIINTQAFASSLKEDGKSKEARIIYSKRDEFGSRKPIDVIAANRPILILDEPQKMGKEDSATQKALQRFNPLFSINYSATHAKEHNMVYVLDALEAYNQRLVKKIEVKGFEMKNLLGTDKYLFLESIVLSPNKPPMARIELEVRLKSGKIKRETKLLGQGDNFYYVSGEMEQYKGISIAYIDPIMNMVELTTEDKLFTGMATGDISESDRRRIQIRETILSHFEKEEKLFEKGIKTLSLFFIDEVAKYRQYDENGDETIGEYGKIFEEEYEYVLNAYRNLEESPYQKYLNKTAEDISAVHKGYFSIDKKTGRSINSETKKGSEFSDDISAYDLILKNKERLLSFEEPTRFIFSHSALREGWDNPNIFQICTLRQTKSDVAKRQEVGRGLRLCVNQDGNRMDVQTCGDTIHDINVLTVIANESYADFTDSFQKDIKKDLYDRPSKATMEYFEGKTVFIGDDEHAVSAKEAKAIYRYLLKNDYIDDDDNVTDTYRADLANGCLAVLPEEIKGMEAGIHKLVQGVFDESVLKDMISNGHDTKVKENPLNDNFYKKEFQTLWKYINHKYAYTVDFKSEELIEKATKTINEKLSVAHLQYTLSVGEQKKDMNQYEIERGDSFVEKKTKTSRLERASVSKIKYDLVGDIAKGTTLTRKTVVEILKGLDPDKLYMFRVNPEEFITKVCNLILDEKSALIVEHVTYDTIQGEYDSSIFTAENSRKNFDKAFRATKAIQDYVFTDGMAEQSVERKFVQKLDTADEVCVYAKLPRSFAIPTPVGSYAPDWAIAFYEGSVKHIYFIAETKGSMRSMDLRGIEKAKIDCAHKLFDTLSNDKVKYHEVSSYEELMGIVV